MASADSELQKTGLVIGCFDDVPEYRVYFEPTGALRLLRSGDSVTVEAVLPLAEQRHAPSMGQTLRNPRRATGAGTTRPRRARCRPTAPWVSALARVRREWGRVTRPDPTNFCG